MANIMFQIQNNSIERVKILSVIIHELENNNYFAGKYTNSKDNFEEIIRHGYEGNDETTVEFFGMQVSELQPYTEFWYKIPYRLFEKLLQYDFSTFNLKLGRKVYYETISKDGFRKYFTHKLLNSELNVVPGFKLNLPKEKPQRVYPLESFSKGAFVHTNKNKTYLHDVDYESFEFVQGVVIDSFFNDLKL